jgi:hypothetical protein
MALYEESILKHMLGAPLLTLDWRIALYNNGISPLTSIGTAEIAGTREPLPAMTWSAGTTSMVSTAPVIWGPMSACTAGGWFIVNGATETNILWYQAFSAPVAVSNGDYVTLPSGYMSIGLA